MSNNCKILCTVLMMMKALSLHPALPGFAFFPLCEASHTTPLTLEMRMWMGTPSLFLNNHSL